MGWFEGIIWRWVLIWRRVLSIDESREESQLNSLLQQHKPSRSARDTVKWDQSDKFSVRSFYVKAVNQMVNAGSVDSLVCSVWQKLAPPKVEFMVWLALLGKLNTRDRLVQKRMIPEELNHCTFYLTILRTLIIYYCPARFHGLYGNLLQQIWVCS